MIQAPDLPLWATLLASFLVLAGAGAAFIGSLGLVRLKTFYDRIHAPTLSTSMGTMCILLASICVMSVAQSRFVAHEILIFVFVSLTTPVTLMLLARAALYRDRIDRNGDVPPGDT